MRFNNRFCALMDIPDLPHGAFEHIGDGKIKPQGGGNPVSFITDPVKTAVKDVQKVVGQTNPFNPGSAAGKAIAQVPGVSQLQDAGTQIFQPLEKAIVKPSSAALSQVDKAVAKAIPGGWGTVATVAASMIPGGQFAALGLSKAAVLGGLGALSGSGVTHKGQGFNAKGAAIGGALGYGAGSLASGLESSATASGISSEAGKEAFFQSLATGASGSEAVSAGLAAEALAPAVSSALTTDQILGSTGFIPAEGSGASFAIDPTAAYTTASSATPIYDFSEPYSPDSTGAPVYDYSTPVDITPGGNTVPAGTSAEEMAAYDIVQKSAGEEALAKYGGMSTLQKANMGLNAARGLLAQQPRPQQQQMQIGRAVTNPSGAVDYSGLLNLLSPRTKNRSNPYSLLG